MLFCTKMPRQVKFVEPQTTRLLAGVGLSMTGLAGPIGTAVAAGKVMGFDEDRMTAAIDWVSGSDVSVPSDTMRASERCSAT